MKGQCSHLAGQTSTLDDFGRSRMESLTKGYTITAATQQLRVQWQAEEFLNVGDDPPPSHTRETDAVGVRNDRLCVCSLMQS